MRFEFLPQWGEIQNLCVGIDLSFQSVARQVFSALLSLTSVFGMGTGGPSALLTPTAFCNPRSDQVRRLQKVVHLQGLEPWTP